MLLPRVGGMLHLQGLGNPRQAIADNNLVISWGLSGFFLSLQPYHKNGRLSVLHTLRRPSGSPLNSKDADMVILAKKKVCHRNCVFCDCVFKAIIAPQRTGHPKPTIGNWYVQQSCSRCLKPRYKACGVCGVRFRSKRKKRYRKDRTFHQWERFCSNDCRQKHECEASDFRKECVCENCGNTFTKKDHGGRNAGRFCTRSCYWEARKNGTFKGNYASKEYLCNHKKRCEKRGLPFDKSVTREALVSKYGPECYICGKKTGWRDGDLEQTVEHVVPLSHPDNNSHGHTWENCLIACLGCNSIKKDRTTPEMIASEAPVDVVLQSGIPVLSANELYSRHP